MKTPALLSAFLLVAAPAAAQAPEAAAARGAAAFAALGAFKPSTDRSASVLGKPVEPPRPVKAKSSEWVTVSGNITLNGSGFVAGHSNFVTVDLSGWTTVSDMTGRVRSYNEHVSVMGNFFVNGSWVNGSVYPSAYVSLYRDGKYVGQGRIEGTVFVSGYVNGSWVSVNGSGTLRGTILVND